jgi:hypothetical protein
MIACVAVFAASPARALAEPTPEWTDQITAPSMIGDGVAGREALFTNPKLAGYFDTLQIINGDGTTEYQSSTEGATIPPSLAADGSGYVLLGGGSQEVIEAITSAGARRWRYTLPTGEHIRAILAGGDGAAYVGVSTAAGEEVLRLSPADGSVTFAKRLPANDGIPTQLFAEPHGVAVSSDGGAFPARVVFLSEQGQIVHTLRAAPSGNVEWYASNDSGEVFVGYAPLHGGWAETAKGITIVKVLTTGRIGWKAHTPHNPGSASQTEIAALPDGGVAYSVSGQSVGVVGAAGASRWTSEDADAAGAMAADASGHIDILSLVNNAPCSDGYANCYGLAVEQLSAASGTLVRSIPIVPSEDGGRYWFAGSFAIGGGAIHILDNCSGAAGCNPLAVHAQLQAYGLSETAGPYPTPPVTTEPSGGSPTANYVALGDSYSSGEGNPPYDPGTDEGSFDKCHRSRAAYGPRLDTSLGLGPMTFSACSGAVTQDFFTINHANVSEPKQLSWLSAGTKTVTLTIGGDDAGFVSLLQHCVAGPRASFPFEQSMGCSKDTGLREEVRRRLEALDGGASDSTPSGQTIRPIAEVLESIHTVAPNARIFIGQYPHLFGASKGTYEQNAQAPSGRDCHVGSGMVFGHQELFFVDYADAQWLNTLGDELSAVIRHAVSGAKKQGITIAYVAPKQFTDHGLCDHRESWINSLTLSDTNEPESSSFHPTVNGQRLGYEAAFVARMK